MNIKHKLSILLFSCLLAACTSENELINPIDPNEGSTDDTGRREVLLTLKNKLSTSPTKTKVDDPIATKEENYIRSLDVYVFGSATENGPYTFQELYYYRDDASTINADWAHSFNITATSQENISTALLKLTKGLYVKLYCIANRTQLFQTDATTGVVSEYTLFQPLTQTNPGQPTNSVTPGIPTEADFLKLHSPLIDPNKVDVDTDDDKVMAELENSILRSPLPMTGSYVTPLDLTDFSISARTQLSFKLTRMVARFDVINNAEESRFTIEQISMVKGQKGAGFFPIKPLTTKADELIAYPLRNQSALTQAASPNDITEGAFYTWPSPKDDQGYLVLKGKYAANKTENVDVSYQVPFQQITNGIGSYIEVAYNHRYTISITKADTYHLDFKLEVADWEDGESVDEYEPDNSFDKTAKVVLSTEPDANNGAYVLNNGNISLLPKAGSKFAFSMGSNSLLTEDIIYKTGSAEWLIKGERTKATGASMETTFTYKVDDTKLTETLLPVTIRLTNKASGARKEITVVPTQGPTISWKSVDGNYNTFDPKTMKATIYNVASQAITLHALAETRTDPETKTETTGSTAAVVGSPSWLSVAGDGSAAEADYTITLSAAQTPATATATVDFTSTASTAVTTVNVELKSPDITPLTDGDFNVDKVNNTVDLTGDGGKPKVSLLGTLDNSVVITITSPEGVTAEATGGNTWLEVTTGKTISLANGSKQTVITAKIKDATDMDTTAKGDGMITITNPIDNTKSTIKVITTVPTPAP